VLFSFRYFLGVKFPHDVTIDEPAEVQMRDLNLVFGGDIDYGKKIPHETIVEPDLDLGDIQCSKHLRKFCTGEISLAKTTGSLAGFGMTQVGKKPKGYEVNFGRSLVAVSNTDDPFYISTHDARIDSIRECIMVNQQYYESDLSTIIAHVFHMKRAMNKQSIMLDVGGNIGWFSLLAVASGATKVYYFEPNLQNTVRLC
jgi:hypothetical protein